jgi:GNAT superfamily N-acetyltransferase
MADAEPVTLRSGTPDDGFACYGVLFESVNDLARRTGTDPIPGEVGDSYARSEPMFRYLAETAAEFWVAEEQPGGKLIGYARSIGHGGFFELTEFFVLPGHQAAGVGRRLLERAFPEGRGELRVIVATTDVRALARYAKAGMTARTVVTSLVGTPVPPAPPASTDRDLAVERLAPDGPLEELAALDREIAGFDRGPMLTWLATSREALLFRREGHGVGYGFVSERGIGPIGAADPRDLPAILDEVLRRVAALSAESANFEVPMSNGSALRHLLSRGLRIDAFLTVLLSNREFGHLDRYLGYSPPIFL